MVEKQWHIETASFTGVGKRPNNEDNYFSDENGTTSVRLFMVCDGVGGQNKGEVASSLVVSSFAEFIKENPDYSDINWVQEAIKFTEMKFDNYQQNHPDTNGMASTLTLVAFREKDVLIAHCGDSRVYHFRGREILFQTKDHSYVNWLIDRGEITPEQAEQHPKRNVITRCISGIKNPTKADVHLIADVQANDFILLCTDGFLEAWNNRELIRLMQLEHEVQSIAEEMTDKCSLLSDDNYTAILIKIK